MLRRALMLLLAVAVLVVSVADPAIAQTRTQPEPQPQNENQNPPPKQNQTQDGYAVKKSKSESSTSPAPPPPASRPTTDVTPPAREPRASQPVATPPQPAPSQQVPVAVPAPTGQFTTAPAPPAPPSAPSSVAERVLRNKIGSEGLQRLLNDGVPSTPGRGGPNADRWFDVTKPAPPVGSEPAVAPSGTPVFQGRPQGVAPQGQPATTQGQPGATAPRVPPGVQLQQSPPVRIQRVEPPSPTIGEYKSSTPQDLKGVKENYGGIPGGVVLEGVATGLGRVDRVSYDAKFNALSFDDRAVYFAKVPPRTLAVMCRAIAQDDRVGVSLGKKHIVYGAVPPDSALASDLKLADHFLGDIVFAGDDWTGGYRFPNGFRPRPNEEKTGHVAVFFNFNGFGFTIEEEEVRLTAAKFDVRLVPLTEQSDASGAHQPDLDAVARGAVSRQYESNARHIAENIGYYQRERIISRTFAYGEVAALVRALKRAGVDLQQLAGAIETGAIETAIPR